MAWEEDEALLEEYVAWKAQKQVAGVDVTPAAFLVDRTKEVAFQRVLDSLEYIEHADTVHISPEAKDDLKKILEG